MKKQTTSEKIKMLIKISEDKTKIIANLVQSNVAMKELYNRKVEECEMWRNLVGRYELQIFTIPLAVRESRP